MNPIVSLPRHSRSVYFHWHRLDAHDRKVMQDAIIIAGFDRIVPTECTRDRMDMAVLTDGKDFILYEPKNASMNIMAFLYGVDPDLPIPVSIIRAEREISQAVYSAVTYYMHVNADDSIKTRSMYMQRGEAGRDTAVRSLIKTSAGDALDHFKEHKGNNAKDVMDIFVFRHAIDELMLNPKHPAWVDLAERFRDDLILANAQTFSLKDEDIHVDDTVYVRDGSGSVREKTVLAIKGVDYTSQHVIGQSMLVLEDRDMKISAIVHTDSTTLSTTDETVIGVSRAVPCTADSIVSKVSSCSKTTKAGGIFNQYHVDVDGQQQALFLHPDFAKAYALRLDQSRTMSITDYIRDENAWQEAINKPFSGVLTDMIKAEDARNINPKKHVKPS